MEEQETHPLAERARRVREVIDRRRRENEAGSRDLALEGFCRERKRRQPYKPPTNIKYVRIHVR